MAEAANNGEEETETSIEADEGDAEDQEAESVDTTPPIPTEGGTTDPELREPQDREPAVATLWELGQFVTYVMVKFLNSLVHGSRVMVAKATGANEPVDRLTPVSHQSRQPDPSRWSVWIVLGLLAVVVVLIALAVVA